MPPVELCEGIDLAELRAWAASDPLQHAFALYDVEHFADRIRFVSVRSEGELAAYLLVWYGDPSGLWVHWVGTNAPEVLVRGLPAPPFTAYAPPEVVELVRHSVPVRSARPLHVMRRLRGLGPSSPASALPPGVAVRRLTPEDLPMVRRFGEAHAGDAGGPPPGDLDPLGPRVHAAVLEGPVPRILALARDMIELPTVWIIGGVYTEAEERGKGLARAVVASLIDVAQEAGADSALYVLEDNAAALRTYTSLGFCTVTRKVLMDATGGTPS